MKHILMSLWVSIAVFGITLKAQEIYPERNGVKNVHSNYHAFTHATIHPSSSKIIEDATLLIHKGKVVAVGKNLKTPKNCVVHNYKGKHIYPSFIDLFSNYGIPPKKKPQKTNQKNIKSSRLKKGLTTGIKPYAPK